MTPTPSDHPTTLELMVAASHPALLEGLDEWLRLGLLSDEAVRQICQEKLVCPLPVQETVVPSAQTEESADFLSTPERPQSATPLPRRRLANAVQSFMAEISVIWLLFLGVFLVVLSSGVLAATQWRNFSSTGQYLILLGYTLVFWLAATLTGKRPSLRLTSRMLQITTLLIVPVNFWMMDGFRLWNTAPGIAIAAIAALVLSAIPFFLLQPTSGNPRLYALAAIVLSWLHWGWSVPVVPLLATYAGTIGATVVLLKQEGEGERGRGGEGEDGEDGEGEAERENVSPLSPIHPPLSPTPHPLSLGFITVAASTLLLIFRALFIRQIPIDQLGLAVGVCGWLLCWLSRNRYSRRIWTFAGGALLVLGWAATWEVVPPWQAIAITGLILWLLAYYLRRTGEGQYLSAAFLVGLPLGWFIWRLIPVAGREWVIATCTAWAGTQFMPFALLGLGFFPYVVFTVALAFRLGPWNSARARQAELLALCLGVVLTEISLGNPWVRSINLTLSALTLIVVINRRRPEVPLVYLTHATVLGAIATTIDYTFPNLPSPTWAIILLAVMTAEWLFTGYAPLPSPPPSPSPSSPPSPSSHPWQKSAWYYGLALTVPSYVLLQGEGSSWGWLWLLPPLMLTWLSSRPFFQHRTAAWLGVLALFPLQGLMVDSTVTRLTGLGVATLLMLQNTRVLRHLLAAVITVGFGVAFALVGVWEIFRENLSYPWFLVLLAIVPLVLWLLRGIWLHREAVLLQLYKRATDGWAIALASFTLLLLSLTQLAVYLEFDPFHWQYILAAAVLLIATSYRIWQSRLQGGLYLPAWSVELLLLSGIAANGRSLDTVGVANLALGLLSQLAGDWWANNRIYRLPTAPGQNSQSPTPPAQFPTPPPSAGGYPRSFHLIPLLYALLGLILMHRTFTATTGLCTLAAAVLVMGVGRRHISLKFLAALSLLGVSFGAYELLIYQLSLVQGENAGDGLVLLAALGAALAIALRLLLPWVAAYLRLTPWEVLAIAHIHWLIANTFLLFALFTPRSSTAEWQWLGVSAFLAAYSLSLANHQTSPTVPLPPTSPPPSLWTYPGIFQSLLTLAYLLHLLLPDTFLLEWGGTIAAITGCVLYLAPWHRWGWEQTPWRNSAAVLPGLVTVLTAGSISLQGLLIVAAFYAWLARMEQRVRLSYLSVVLADWAILRYLYQQNSTEPLWQAAVLSASLLYGAQIDPALRSPSEREKRHWLRCLPTGLVCLTAFYQAEVGMDQVPPILVGMLAIGLALGFILAGILLQVRAFLYVGTITFILQILRQMWRFIGDYSLLLWATGIGVGLLLIWIAATFEARRTQVSTLLNYWTSELDNWD
jgi:hypothetical protein